MLLWLIVACTHPVELEPVVVDPTAVFAMPPRLPSPQSDTYARVARAPTDLAVASVIGDHRWDASLSGAAASLALRSIDGHGGTAPWEVREALWRAGYPYGARRVGSWTVRQGAPPPEALLQWVALVGPHDDLGLVRARSARGDLWVALHASPLASIGAIPRVLPVGGSVTLPRLAGARWVVGDPDGRLLEGTLDDGRRLALSSSGEWLFQIRDDRGEIARFPVYVGDEPPVEPLLRSTGGTPANGDDALAGVIELLRVVRDAWELRPLPRYPMFDSAAEKALVGGPVDDAMLAAGVGPDQYTAWSCRARTVVDCVDQVVWSPRSRAALIALDTSWMGLAATVSPDGEVRVAGVWVADPGVASE